MDGMECCKAPTDYERAQYLQEMLDRVLPAHAKMKEALERIRGAIALESDAMLKLAAVMASQTYRELFIPEEKTDE